MTKGDGAKSFGSCISTRLGAAVTALLLASCGGGDGGGGGPPPPPPANRPPAITSPATANAAENATGTIYTATATDPDGDALTFSLSGGADRAAFSITAAGALSFAQPPDFENPTDADTNNVYLVQISVSDGTTSTTLDLAVTLTNVGPDGFRVRRVATGLQTALYLTAIPDNSGRVLVVQQTGQIRILDPVTNTLAPTPFLDVSGQIATDGERGLLGLALAPDFNATGTFYIFMTDPAGRIQLRRYRTFAGNRDQADPATADTIIDLAHPASNHNGGWLDFGPDGNLYAALGDGGGGGDPANNAQNLNVLYGKIIRIDPRTDSFPADPLRDYAIPAGNPFTAGGGAPEIWALGLRNPFRNSFDPPTGNLWIGDVGEIQREEINLMRPTDAGANFGWRIMEGTLVFSGTPNASLVPPVAEYSRGAGPREGRSVTGGYVYRGPVEALRGNYFFADFAANNIWSLPIARISIGTTIPSSQFTLRNAAFAPDAGTIGRIASFGLDQAGNLYLVDYNGQIFRVEAT
ncbi:MAG TPA: PQQ-dependent sugar dehydrogenase [Allosphingosinicella sp.]|nr:PQQ-dependent sugar dehydrogenase [Allosphingosinicella sp.]